MSEKQIALIDEEEKQDNKNSTKKVWQGVATTAAIGNAVIDTSQRHGMANAYILDAYDGVNSETGQKMHQSLKGISKSKVNPNDIARNKSQQAGYSGEVLDTAMNNADRVVAGDKTRISRTDDLGRVNDQLHDQVTLDADRNIVDGSGIQMKILKSGDTFVGKVSGKKYQNKYPDGKFKVPKDQYDTIKKELSDKIAKLESQTNRTPQKQEQMEYLKKVEKNLEKAKVSRADSLFARDNPELITAKQVAGYTLGTGLEGAKVGAKVGATMAVINNLSAVIKGEKDIQQASVDALICTGKASAIGGAFAVTGAATNTALFKYGNETMKALSKTNVPVQIITVVIETGKSFKRYLDGEIDGQDLFLELGDKGFGMVVAGAASAPIGVVTAGIGASVGAALGTLAIPIPIVGTLTGALIGKAVGFVAGIVATMITYTLSSMFYNAMIGPVKEAKFAREERLRIEAECEIAIRNIRETRAEMEIIMNTYLAEHTALFNQALRTIGESLMLGDADGVIGGANMISRKLGGNPQFETVEEFNALMDNPLALKL